MTKKQLAISLLCIIWLSSVIGYAQHAVTPKTASPAVTKTTTTPPSYSFSSVSHTVGTDKEYEGECLILRANCSINGKKGQKIRFIATIEFEENGKWFRVTNNPALRNVDKDGSIFATSYILTPSYDASTYNDLRIAMPLRRIPHRAGSQKYRATIKAVSSNGSTIPYKSGEKASPYLFSLTWNRINQWYTDKNISPQDMYLVYLNHHHKYLQNDGNRTDNALTALDWLVASADARYESAINDMIRLCAEGYAGVMAPNLAFTESWVKEGLKHERYKYNAQEMKAIISAYKKYKDGRSLSASEQLFLSQVFLHAYFGEQFNPDKYVSLIESAARRGDEDAISTTEEGSHYADVAYEYVQRGNLEKARIYGQKAIQVYGTYGFTENVGFSLATLGMELKAKGQNKAAYDRFLLGMEFGNGTAAAELALCYGEGRCVTKDIDKAYALMQTARTMRGYYDTKGDYESAYNSYGRQINARNLSTIQSKQKNAENQYKSYNSSSSSSLSPFIKTAAIIAGICAICDIAEDLMINSRVSSSAPSSSSVASSYAHAPNYQHFDNPSPGVYVNTYSAKEVANVLAAGSLYVARFNYKNGNIYLCDLKKITSISSQSVRLANDTGSYSLSTGFGQWFKRNVMWVTISNEKWYLMNSHKQIIAYE